jgi:hypothetical protein
VGGIGCGDRERVDAGEAEEVRTLIRGVKARARPDDEDSPTREARGALLDAIPVGDDPPQILRHAEHRLLHLGHVTEAEFV